MFSLLSTETSSSAGSLHALYGHLPGGPGGDAPFPDEQNETDQPHTDQGGDLVLRQPAEYRENGKVYGSDFFEVPFETRARRIARQQEQLQASTGSLPSINFQQ